MKKRSRYFVFPLLGLIAGVLAIAWSHPDSPSPAIGASGDCKDTLAVALIPVDLNDDGIPDDAQATVAAVELLDQVYPPPVYYTGRRIDQEPDSTRTHLTFSCEDYDSDAGVSGVYLVVFVDLWIGSVLVQSCQSIVHLTDSTGVCTPHETTAVITGVLSTENGLRVSNVSVVGLGTLFSTVITDSTGRYTHSAYPPAQIQITPQSPGDYLNGVTTADLVRIQRHILTVDPLPSPYLMIAADANLSNSISLQDVIWLRRLILGVIQELPFQKSWRFILASYQFPEPDNPWHETFPESAWINTETGAYFQRHFRAVKLGDVNFSAVSP